MTKPHDEEQDAEDSGYAAFWDGAEQDENPYPYGTKKWNSWEKGWLKGKEEEEEPGI